MPRWRPKRLMVAAMLEARWPVTMRCAQAASVESKSAALGISRVGRLPSWWQSWQPCLSRSIQWACVRTVAGMPLPSPPVPGNSAFSGTSISEYQ